MSTTSKAAIWPDTNLYPFNSHYIQLKAGRMHYIDEGQGEVLLFVHGTPTWSFLYRDFIKNLSKDYRCIAIDHLGFGLSEKPDNFSGTPEAHSANLSEFIEMMKLENITLVLHDFGGPIGLGWANAHPEKVKRVILFNTWLWETESNPEVTKVDKLINSWLGRFLYLNLNFSPKVLLKKGFDDKSKLTKKVHQQYLKPFPDKASRKGLYTLAKSLRGSTAWYQEQWQQLDVLEHKPVLILWGMKDQFLKPEFLQKWQARFPSAMVQTFDCGHFVQEEKTEESIKALWEFLKTKPGK